MGQTLIKNGHVIDPANGRNERADVLLEEGKIGAISRNMTVEGAELIDAEECVVVPGFIDTHTHLRTPGQEYKEDIASGTRAAIRGGYTAVLPMANTQPPIDNETGIRFILDQAQTQGVARVYPVGAITKGLKGDEIAELGLMKRAGACAFSDDGMPVRSARVMRFALQYSKMFGVPLSVHEEDPSLTQDGVVNWGRISTKMGLPGIPAESEVAMVARDLELCRVIGGHLHIAHVSTARAVHLIREAKAAGICVTCEVTPHHLTLTEDLVHESGYDTNTKMKPPLRTQDDQRALLSGLKDGTIDLIATDHAPHSFDDKDKEYLFADFGIVGLETAFALLHDRLVLTQALSLEKLIEAMTWRPAQVFGLSGGSLSEGVPADITILSTSDEWAVNPKEFASKSANTPLTGWSLTGRVRTVLVDGQVRLRDGTLTC